MSTTSRVGARTRTTRPQPAAARPAGRPRDPRLDATVLDATRRLLREIGYSRLSIEAIARAAGITRPAIYRRWRSKAELVHEAVYPAGGDSRRGRDTGDVARDLRARVRYTIGLYTRPEVRAALPGLMADYRDDPDLQRKLMSRMADAARADFARLLEDARRRGAIAPAVSPEVLFDALSGTAIFRIMTAGVGGIERLEEELTSLLLAGATGGPNGRSAAPARPRDGRDKAARPRRHAVSS